LFVAILREILGRKAMNVRAALVLIASGLLLLAADYARRQYGQAGDYGAAPDWSDHARALANEALQTMTSTSAI
jgi:hypothetical protein